MARILLTPYAAAMVDYVRSLTGYPIQLMQVPSIEFDSEVRLARPGQPRHEVTFAPNFSEYAIHFLVSGARKTLRFYNAPPADRYLPGSVPGRRLPTEDEEELRRQLPIPEDELREISRFLFDGTLRQLTSFPVDLRVERDLYYDLPQHRPLQQAYLRRQVEDIEPHFDREIANVAPSRVYSTSTAMNIVLVEEAAELAGTPIGPLARSSPHRAMGTWLRQILHETRKPGHRGDRLVTDAWAEKLEMRDWYEWVCLSR
jgi:hypothetical protein